MPKKIKTYVLIISKNFPAHHDKAGTPTNFIPNILNKKKLHTIRNNYPLWKKRIEAVNRGEAIISLRIWNGKPYVDKQIEILKIHNAQIQQLNFYYDEAWINETQPIDKVRLAINDGLTLPDLKSWFKGYPKNTLGLIHFTNFRY